MKDFARLYDQIQSTRSTLEKVAAMQYYFANAPDEEAAVAIFLLSGRRIKRLITYTQLRDFVIQKSGLPGWLIHESHQHVGDFAETIQLLNPGVRSKGTRALSAYYKQLLDLQGASDYEKMLLVSEWFEQSSGLELMLLIKLLTGGMRVGVSEKLVAQAISEWTGQSVEAISQCLLGNWEPGPEFMDRLQTAESQLTQLSPRPFCLASPVPEDKPIENIGDASEFQIEWKWDGIRAQIIFDGNDALIWSRGEEYITEQFPEIALACKKLENPCILDGELIAWGGDKPSSFSQLQKRLGRKKVSAANILEVPIAFIAYDLLQVSDEDCRPLALQERIRKLEALVGGIHPLLHVSKRHMLQSWQDVEALRAEAETQLAEGLMIKKLDSPYALGRKRGIWWKWKIDPKKIDVVMTGAELGHGRRANLFTDYTFSILHGEELLPIAKAYSGLTDDEIARLDSWIRKNTTGQYGNMRTVKPEQVFELAFEGIAESKRHKSGIALRFPRISRWRDDKTAKDIDTLETAKALLPKIPGNSYDLASTTQMELTL